VKPRSVFVYGTLQRGQSRASHWPLAPVEVQPATVRGRLFDLGPYPALVSGDDWVLGELWHFQPEHIDPTLAVLDAIEGFGQEGPDLYRRGIAECHELGGPVHRAYAYWYARYQDLDPLPPVRPNAEGYCVWKGEGTAAKDKAHG
jgi:gamma-glutamylcyclotransferase (GGCT)/AIG2-like uncharacterized protein YtfP